MKPLPVLPPLANPPEKMRLFASALYPLRPSSLRQVGACPMSAVMYDLFEGDGKVKGAADTGSMVHLAAAAFHRAANTMSVQARTEEGLAALEAARLTFPEGNFGNALKTFKAYAEDKENIDADCPWVEQHITIQFEPAPFDPTRTKEKPEGEPVVILGTLDQIRRDKYTKRLTLWDIKTGSRKSAAESKTAYLTQQACYLIGARQHLSPDVEMGGLIYTPGYEKKLGKRFIPYSQTPEECIILVSTLVYTIALIRQGIAIFQPGVDTCEWCKSSRKSDQCLTEFRTSF